MPAIRPCPTLLDHPPRHVVTMQREARQGTSVDVFGPLPDPHSLISQPQLKGVSRRAPTGLADLRGIDTVYAQLSAAPTISRTHPHGVTIEHARDFGAVAHACRTAPQRG